MIKPEVNIVLETEIEEETEVAALIRRCVEEVLTRQKIEFPAQVDVTIVEDDAIRLLNAEYRDKDMATDVLSFPLYEFYNGEAKESLAGEESPENGRILLGDMILNYARACQQAEEYGHSPARECGFLTVHSVLHLLGFDHERGEDDQKKMRAEEEAALTALGLVRP